jgi:hypothetical protein
MMWDSYQGIAKVMPAVRENIRFQELRRRSRIVGIVGASTFRTPPPQRLKALPEWNAVGIAEAMPGYGSES